MAAEGKSPAGDKGTPPARPLRHNFKRTQTMHEMAIQCKNRQPNYAFGDINRDTPKKSSNRAPVFLAHDGTLFDIDYIPIAKKDLPTLEHSTSAPNLDQNNHVAHSQSAPNPTTFPTSPSTPPSLAEMDIMKQFADSFPTPLQFDTFFDYEQSLLAWKQRMESGLGGLRLPTVMGRKFHRPKVVESQGNGLDDTMNSTRSSSSLENSLPEASPSPSTPTQISEVGSADPVENAMHVRDDDEDTDAELEVDPWDSVLVPAIPSPLDYDTFEDYEEALQRWTLICSSIPFLPPHAEHLKDLIPIQPLAAPVVKPNNTFTKPKTSVAEPQVEWKVRLVLSELPFFDSFKHRPLVPSEPQSSSFPPITEFVNLSPQERATLEQIFAKRLAAQAETLKNYGRHNAPLLPRIHGTLPKPYTNSDDTDMFGGGGGGFGGGPGSGYTSPFGGGGGGSPFGGTVSSSPFGTGSFGTPTGTFGTMPKTKNKPKMLRRTDLTKDMMDKCLDCLPEYDGVKVEFKIPEFELYNIDLQRLSADPAYKDELQKSVVAMQHADRHDALNSWYYPTVPIEVHHTHREIVKYLMSDKFDISVLSKILAGEMYLDKFQDLLSETCREEEDGSASSYLKIFLSCVTPDNFPHLLSMFANHESRLLHGKLAAFITEATQSSKGKMLCEYLITNRDVKSLSYVAYGMTYFNEVPVDIYPWHSDTFYAVKKFMGIAIEPLLIIFSYYYVNLICQAINKQPFLFVGLSPFINEARRTLATALGKALQTQPDFVGKYVFRGLAHRSQKISHMCLFVLVQLLTQQNTESPLVQSNLRSDVTNLINNTKDLTDSKYMHVQLTARRIFDILLVEPWQDFLYADYQNNPEQLKADMLRPSPRKGISTLCSIALQLSISALSKVTNTEASKKRIAFLMDEVLFHSILGHIVKNAHHIEQSTVALAELLYHLAKTYVRLGNIAGTQNVKTTTLRRTGNFTLTLSPIDIQKLLTFLSDVANPDVSIVVGVRKHLLATLRTLLKCRTVFDFVKKENDFYARLLVFCRDGNIVAYPVNKEAWNILYVIVHYHAGTMDYLSKSNIINNFLELVAPHSPNIVITNGIHMITKLFSMMDREVAKPRRIKDPKKETLAVLKSDIKILTTIFTEKRFFIKVHMIYKKIFDTKSSAGIYGIVFHAITNFYHVLQTTEGCSKLLKNTSKSVEYKEGLDTVRNMYSPSTGDGVDSPKAPTPKEKKSSNPLTKIPSFGGRN